MKNTIITINELFKNNNTTTFNNNVEIGKFILAHLEAKKLNEVKGDARSYLESLTEKGKDGRLVHLANGIVSNYNYFTSFVGVSEWGKANSIAVESVPVSNMKTLASAIKKDGERLAKMVKNGGDIMESAKGLTAKPNRPKKTTTTAETEAQLKAIKDAYHRIIKAYETACNIPNGIKADIGSVTNFIDNLKAD